MKLPQVDGRRRGSGALRFVTVLLSFVLSVAAPCSLSSADTRARCPLPSARASHSMVFDEARGVVLLFGGVGNGPSPNNQLWEWNAGSWRLLSESGPEPRLDAVMVYDAGRQKVVLFGGQNFPALYGDTWEWDGTQWSKVTEDGPGPRAHTAAAYDLSLIHI